MSDNGATQSPIERAQLRLSKALDALDSALQRRLNEKASSDSLLADIQLLENDRSRLAAELDAARADNEALSALHADVDQRIGNAMETVRSVLNGAARS